MPENCCNNLTSSIDNPRIKRLSWDETFMSLALMVAQRTACKFHTAGAVIVDDNNRIISMGYNGPTEGDYHCLEVGCAKVDGNPITKKLERCRGAHAEVNAIINAQNTRRLRGSTIYSVILPCYDCMKALNNVGIKEIVYYELYKRIKSGGASTEEETETWELAKKRGITIRQYQPDIEINLEPSKTKDAGTKNILVNNTDDQILLALISKKL
jgi:dCMP deaminase